MDMNREGEGIKNNWKRKRHFGGNDLDDFCFVGVTQESTGQPPNAAAPASDPETSQARTDPPAPALANPASLSSAPAAPQSDSMPLDDEFLTTFNEAISSLVADAEEDEELHPSQPPGSSVSTNTEHRDDPTHPQWLRLDKIFLFPAEGENTNSLGLYWPGGQVELDAELQFYDLTATSFSSV
jgi:hypothetical protein